MSIKKFFILLLLIVFYSPCCFAIEPMNPAKNAYRHNNKGLIYLEEKYYFGAIKEFQIAIDLNPNTQATAVYYQNLGKTYEKIGHDNLAKTCYEKALTLNILCFDYYLTLAQHYKKMGIAQTKLEEFKNNKLSPLNEVMAGLLYIQTGNVTAGITLLDDFCNKESNLLITAGIKDYLKKLASS